MQCFADLCRLGGAGRKHVRSVTCSLFCKHSWNAYQTHPGHRDSELTTAITVVIINDNNTIHGLLNTSQMPG